MFHSARVRLTLWYLLIIMLVSVLFSVVIYTGINQELERFDQMQRQRYSWELERFDQMPFIEPMPEYDSEIVARARMRLTIILVLINLGILGASGIAGYFLAGRTLRPIQDMVDDQNRFIADASHELRTPITSLKTTTEVNLRDKHLNLKRAKEVMKSNLEDANTLQILSDDLIHLAQYKKPNGTVVFQELSIVAILQLAIDRLTPIAAKKNIVIKADMKDEKVKVDKKSILELFVILLDNAIKYSPDNSQVHITAKKSDHYVKVQVRDQGIGIDKKDLPHIFDRFYRAEKSRSKEDTQGFGLGLSIAKEIVKIHKGEIYITSEKGKGTTCIVKLPVFEKDTHIL